MKNINGGKSRCVICGRYFCSDCRVGARQKTCGPECSHKLKLKRDCKWRRDNHDYFLSDSRNGVEHPVRKRGGILQVEISSEKPVKSASADVGVRFSLHRGSLQVQIPREASVTRVSAVGGGVDPGG